MLQKPLIILTGPTAVGKTKSSVQLAKKIGGEIISADSMQVYRGMDIGSAKIRPEEREGVPHYLIDVLEPEEEFNVVRFQQMAKAALEQIYSNGHIPIVAGGTGFYIQALLYDIDFSQSPSDTDARYRQELTDYATTYGAEALHQKLMETDPQAAQDIHANNIKRVIRALEFYHQTGERISEHNERERSRQSPYRSAYFVLTDEREHLYRRIEKRIDQMLKDGLVEEVRRLKDKGLTKDMVSMQGLGYKEILRFLEGECTLSEAVCILKRDTRRFAKRQLTWFRREQDVLWIDKKEFGYDENVILNQILARLTDKGILKEQIKEC